MKLARSVVAIMAIAALVACDDEDEPTGPNGGNVVAVADLAGSYQVGSFTYVSDANAADQVNLTALGMGVTALNVTSNGSFTGTLVFPDPNNGGAPTEFPIGGTISLSNATANGATLTINFNAATQALGILDATETGTLALDGDVLTMTLTEVTFPAGVPGAGADANLIMVATRG